MKAASNKQEDKNINYILYYLTEPGCLLAADAGYYYCTAKV